MIARRLLVLLACAGAVAFAAWSLNDRTSEATPVAQVKAAQSVSALQGKRVADSAGSPGRRAREPLGEAAHDPFRPTARALPPPAKKKELPAPPPLPAPEPRPTPPAFTYQAFGKLTDPEGRRVVYFVKDNRLIAIAPEMELDGGYRVESVSESQVVVRHNALGERMTVRLPENPK